MKKWLMLVVMVFVLSACGNNTWVLEKERVGEVGEVASYVNHLQLSLPDFRGYSVFTISEGKKMVVVSTGTPNQTLEFVELETTKERTTITVTEKQEETDENNPYILIGVSKIKGELVVVTEDGEEFEEK
ncbi:hypothetical protein [Alkalihalobacillus sp. LMS39]|uniref:hypothetical protein n=1 Tax=Alkalihalobacillus sp. LMS39 TaxID=2924032 RepID=UPI001FB44BB5|nr:hypothetical protein [Alkalihalobacillus sp. LMS39]UOE93906.1 hypothetical protein MM271_22480 [Alkalihalobacillus sp. LMS39]